MPKPLRKIETPPKLVTLRNPVALKTPRMKVNREKRTITGLSIITMGPALGHDFLVDAVMLGQVEKAINAHTKGIKSRLTHPGIPDCGGQDGINTLVGRVSNASVAEDQVYGDVKFGDYTKKNPAGDLAEYVMDIAEEDPEICGLSIVFDPAEFEEQKNEEYDEDDPDSPETFQLGRVKDVSAADFVGDPAANAGGLLSRLPMRVLSSLPKSYLDQWIEAIVKLGGALPAAASQVVPKTKKTIVSFSGVPSMDPKLLGLLVAIGLSANPTADQAKTFLSGLDLGGSRASARVVRSFGGRRPA